MVSLILFDLAEPPPSCLFQSSSDLRSTVACNDGALSETMKRTAQMYGGVDSPPPRKNCRAECAPDHKPAKASFELVPAQSSPRRLQPIQASRRGQNGTRSRRTLPYPVLSCPCHAMPCHSACKVQSSGRSWHQDIQTDIVTYRHTMVQCKHPDTPRHQHPAP
ncbi:hypothetical protein BGZ63DRAFT_125066 [Mariannaea sp. PMI_226]|nr:hypothetical protein BGZ63DRAFT_125066 [Mariannaea sp. PMI_226]